MGIESHRVGINHRGWIDIQLYNARRKPIEPAFLFLTPTPTNDNTIPIKTTKDDDDEGSRNNATANLGN